MVQRYLEKFSTRYLCENAYSAMFALWLIRTRPLWLVTPSKAGSWAICSESYASLGYWTPSAWHPSGKGAITSTSFISTPIRIDLKSALFFMQKIVYMIFAYLLLNELAVISAQKASYSWVNVLFWRGVCSQLSLIGKWYWPPSNKNYRMFYLILSGKHRTRQAPYKSLPSWWTEIDRRYRAV